MNLPLTFWEKVDRSGGIDSCWPWTAALTRGYGAFGINGRPRYAHRLVAEAAGLDLSGVIHHVCEEPLCCNPLHLQAMTRTEHNRFHDTLAARQRAKTHCPQGHPYSGENLYVTRRGGRECRVCMRASRRQAASRMRAKRKAMAA